MSPYPCPLCTVPWKDLNVPLPRPRAGDILHQPVRLWAVLGAGAARTMAQERHLAIPEKLLFCSTGPA